MKRVILGTLVGVGFVLTAIAVAEQRGEVVAQGPNPVASSPGTEMIVVPTAVGDSQMLTIVDPKQHVLGVYRINMMSGRIALVSVRNIQWDLQINDLNTEKPLPLEIRSMLEKR